VGSAPNTTKVCDGPEWIWDPEQTDLPDWRVGMLDWPHVRQNLAEAGHTAWGDEKQEARAVT